MANTPRTTVSEWYELAQDDVTSTIINDHAGLIDRDVATNLAAKIINNLESGGWLCEITQCTHVHATTGIHCRRWSTPGNNRCPDHGY